MTDLVRRVRTNSRRFLSLALFSLTSICLLGQSSPLGSNSRARFRALRSNWQVQSSCRTEDSGPILSLAGYAAQGWIPTEVPSTVLAAQVNSGQFEAPFFGMNLRKIPGTDYPIGRLY